MIQKTSKTYIKYAASVIFIALGLLNFIPKYDNYGTDGDEICTDINTTSISKSANRGDDPISKKIGTILANWVTETIGESEVVMTEPTEAILDWSLEKYNETPSLERTPNSIMLECRKIFGTLNSNFAHRHIAASINLVPLNEKIMAQLYGAYDSDNKCWITDIKQGDSYCMKVGKSIYDSNSHQYNFLAAGSAYDKSANKLIEAHAFSGLIEVFVIKEKLGSISVASAGKGYISGSFGKPEEDWDLKKVGENTWGWIIPHKVSMRDYQEDYYRILIPSGKEFTESMVMSGIMRFDIANECSYDCEPIATIISSKISFDASKSKNGIYDAILTIDSSEPDVHLKGTSIRYKSEGTGYKEPLDSVLLNIKSKPDTWPPMGDI